MSMTENKLIRDENEAIDCLKNNKPTSGFYMLQESVDMAIQALEEIQQYRAIGTVKELIKTQIREKVLNVELESYKEIGTIEEFKALKEKNEPKKVFDFQVNKMQSFCEDDFGRDIPCMIDVFQFNCPNCKMSKGKKNPMSTRLITPKSEQFLSVLSDTVEENRLMSICGVSYGRGIIEDAKQLSFCTPRPYLGYLVEAQNLILKGYSPSDVLSYFDTKLYERRSVT